MSKAHARIAAYLLVGLTCSLLHPSLVAGQEFRGTIAGRVTDNTGGVMPGVTVTATNAATNVKSSTTTSVEGTFTIPYLTPGSYAVSAALQGFKTTTREGIDLRIGDRLSIDF